MRTRAEDRSVVVNSTERGLLVYTEGFVSTKREGLLLVLKTFLVPILRHFVVAGFVGSIWTVNAEPAVRRVCRVRRVFLRAARACGTRGLMGFTLVTGVTGGCLGRRPVISEVRSTAFKIQWRCVFGSELLPVHGEGFVLVIVYYLFSVKG